MAGVTAENCGPHDASAGCCSCESNEARFGEATKYQHACRENFILEMSKHGLTKRDIVANLNFFMSVPIEPSGAFTVVDGISAPGNYVDITVDMDVLFVISNCPQINNPCNDFNPTPIRVIILNPREMQRAEQGVWSNQLQCDSGRNELAGIRLVIL